MFSSVSIWSSDDSGVVSDMLLLNTLAFLISFAPSRLEWSCSFSCRLFPITQLNHVATQNIDAAREPW